MSGYTSILVIVDHLPSSCFSSWPMTQSHLSNLHNYSFFTSFPSVVSQATSLLTVAWNSFPTSSSPLEWHWTWSYTSLLDIILKVMVRWNELIRLWNSTSESIATLNKTIGPNSFCSLSCLQQYTQCNYWNHSLLCQQGLSSKHYCSSQAWSCFCTCMCSHWFLMEPSTRIQDR